MLESSGRRIGATALVSISADGDDDDDNDGILDSNDSCPRGALNWLSNSTTDIDSDGCQDMTEDAPIITYQINDQVCQQTNGLLSCSMTTDVSTMNIVPTNSAVAASTWEITPSLPSGLTFNNGAVSGTPTDILSSSTFTIWANNSFGSTAIELTISISESPPQISYSSTQLVFTRGVTINPLTPSVSGGAPNNWEISSALPAGLVFTNGTITGTPIANMTQTTYTIWANNTGGSSSVTILITVNEPVAIISYDAISYNTPDIYTFADFHPSWGTGTMEHHYECASNGYQYDLTSDMTTCQYGSNYDWIAYNGVGSQSGPEENGGIFSAGTYYYTIYDTVGNSLSNGEFHFETCCRFNRCLDDNLQRN